MPPASHAPACSLALWWPWLVLVLASAAEPVDGADAAPGLRLAVFQADVTVPLGHGMMGGAWQATSVVDPLEAHGLVLLGAGEPILLVALDWCEVRNEAYARWQAALAAAAGTQPQRVLVTAVHQHDAPVADLAAERLLRQYGRPGSVCDVDFHERAVAATADELRRALAAARPITHLGMGQARVDRVASNRRYTTPDGQLRFDRTSSTSNPLATAADEGTVDPMLKTLSFWDGERPLAAVSFYAVHPMSYYGAGEVSADFPGLARRRRQRELPAVAQLYCSGASGNVTAGKYNDGARANRQALADRLHAGMAAAWADTVRQPLERIDFRSVPVAFEPRDDEGFSAADLERRLLADGKPFGQCLAALGLSWRQRVASGRPIEIPVVDFGAACLVLLPGEAYVEFQLTAQAMRPECFVCVAGYADGATGYIPTAAHLRERDGNLADWCWVAPGAETLLLDAMRRALQSKD